MKKQFKVNVKQFSEGVTLEDVKAFISSNKELPDLQAYIKTEVLNQSLVKDYLDTPEGMKVLQPRLDSHFTKSLETWKTNNLDGLIDQEVRKRNPEKTPEQIELEKLRKEIEQERADRLRADLKAKALGVAQEKGLPTDLVEYLIANDEETTIANLEKYETVHKSVIENAISQEFKANGREVKPTVGTVESKPLDITDFAKQINIRDKY